MAVSSASRKDADHVHSAATAAEQMRLSQSGEKRPTLA